MYMHANTHTLTKPVNTPLLPSSTVPPLAGQGQSFYYGGGGVAVVSAGAPDPDIVPYYITYRIVAVEFQKVRACTLHTGITTALHAPPFTFLRLLHRKKKPTTHTFVSVESPTHTSQCGGRASRLLRRRSLSTNSFARMYVHLLAHTRTHTRTYARDTVLSPVLYLLHCADQTGSSQPSGQQRRDDQPPLLALNFQFLQKKVIIIIKPQSIPPSRLYHDNITTTRNI